MSLRPLKTVFVNNLSLETTESEFEDAFKKFGTIKKAFIIKDKNHPGETKSRGFGYVIFTDSDDCIKCVNSKVNLGGTKLKLSFAKPRIREKRKQRGDENGSDDEAEEEKPKRKTNETPDDDDKNESSDDDKNESSDDDKNGSSDDDKNESSDDGEEENDEEEEGESTNDDVDSESIRDDEDEEENEDEDEEPPRKKLKLDKPLNYNDAEDGKTLFIRNLSFESVDDDLEEFFEEFGALQYCRIVVDKKTERSRGTGFVRFRNKEDADKCLEEFNNNENGFVIGGRKLNVALAVVKAQAKEKFEKSSDDKFLSKGSNRNLHLVRLTMVRPGTKAAEGLPQEDIAKRTKVEALTREKLKNPNIFVSPTRLCIRNIPVTIDDKELRKTFLKAAGNDRSVKITECRIMRDLTRPNSSGLCKSKGYAFVNFSQHEHALAAAMATNNNPDVFGDKRRLIVDFSLENKSVYELRERRFQKSKNPEKSLNKGEASKGKKGQKFQYPTPAPNTNPGQKTLPSHWGAKIRHKPREDKNKMKKVQKGKQFSKSEKSDKQQQPKKKVREQRDALDTMINKYKQKSS